MKIIVADEYKQITNEFLSIEKPTHVINSCAGRDHIDYKSCEELGVSVIEIDYEHAASCAEHAMGLLSYLTSIGPKNASWTDGEEIKGKRVLIIGAGTIGMAIHKRLRGFECECVEYYDPYAEFAQYTKREQLLPALKRADVAFLACPLSKETKGLFGYQELLALKDSILINVARSQIVDSYHLGNAVRDWGLRVGWDFPDELYKSDWKAYNYLLHASSRERCIMTNHNAWRTREAKERRERAVCEAKRECCETKVSQETAVREAKEEVERSLIKRFRTKPQLSQTAKDANQKVCSKAKARQVSPTESSKLEGDTQVN